MSYQPWSYVRDEDESGMCLIGDAEIIAIGILSLNWGRQYEADNREISSGLVAPVNWDQEQPPV